MLGVLGGMGPMATVDFMGKVVQNTPATCDQEHIQMVVCSAANIPDRTAAILDGGADPFPGHARHPPAAGGGRRNLHRHSLQYGAPLARCSAS